MSEKILFEHQIVEAVDEPGFDSHGSNEFPKTPTPTAINTQGDTNTTDIAQTEPRVILAKNTISKSLPFMMGYVQPLAGPSGYAFGLQWKEKTKIPDAAHPGDDPVIIRTFVESKIREVTLDLTNETAQDIVNLFGDSFPQNYDKFIHSGGQLWDGPNGPLARFFLTLAHQRMISKINTDFTQWLENVSTKKGNAQIKTWAEMKNIIGIISELKEALYKNTGKSGTYWLLVSPKIASYLSTEFGTQFDSAAIFNDRRKPSNFENGYVTTLGDIDVYQYNFFKTPDVTGGTVSDSETEGKMIMGYNGGPNVSSFYYYPYQEYIIQSGEDYYTGQSKIIYRVRDSWGLNPLDTFDKTITSVDNPEKTGKSQYIVSVDLTFTEKLIQP